jgi:hypothetical protein
MPEGTKSMKNNELQEVAESKFQKKERRLSEGRQTMAEHIEAGRALDANTARLKALRLARDAVEKTPPAKSTKVTSTHKKSKPVSIRNVGISETQGDIPHLIQAQSDKLKMAERDGARAKLAQK